MIVRLPVNAVSLNGSLSGCYEYLLQAQHRWFQTRKIRMCHRQFILLLLVMAVGLPVQAQEENGAPPNPCDVEPVFHCAESLDDGSYIGHFGHRNSCPESDEPVDDTYIEIGDDNYFTPEPIDRGQPKVFMPGEHVDEFEVEFTAQEIRDAGEFSWTVLKVGARVDFSKTKDASLDCNNLPY